MGQFSLQHKEKAISIMMMKCLQLTEAVMMLTLLICLWRSFVTISSTISPSPFTSLQMQHKITEWWQFSKSDNNFSASSEWHS